MTKEQRSEESIRLQLLISALVQNHKDSEKGHNITSFISNV
jgi:hypothetical protein